MIHLMMHHVSETVCPQNVHSLVLSLQSCLFLYPFLHFWSFRGQLRRNQKEYIIVHEAQSKKYFILC